MTIDRVPRSIGEGIGSDRVFRQLGERIRTFALLVERQRREGTPGELGTTAQEAARIGMLRQVPLFAGLTERAIASVAQVAAERRFDEGEVLVRQGDQGESFLILVAGRAEVTKDGTPIRTLGRADFLGEIALLDGGSRTATVTATTPVDALVIEREPFLRLMDESPALRFGVMDELTRRLRRDAELVHGIIRALVDIDRVAARSVAAQDVVDARHHRIFDDVLELMRHDPENVERGARIMLASHYLERIGDRVTNSV